MVRESQRETSVAFITGEDTQGALVTCSAQLFNKHIHEVSGSFNDLIGLCYDGCYFLNSGDPVPSCNFQALSFCSGKESSYLLSSKSELYSWGNGPYGELGLGLCKTKVTEPLHIKHKASFTSLTCGQYHGAATDSAGNAYCWGQNFDRQLGLFTKKSVDLTVLRPNAILEEMSFTPVLLPFSIKCPVMKIACGAKFTIALGKNGDVWSFGAGECGQLGTGRCTNKEVPSTVVFGQDDSNIKIIDVAAGDAHVLAVAADHSVYSWGMNKKGNLGLGDTNTRHAPALISGLHLQRVFAEGNSSAGITGNGELFTWGCGTSYRLMQYREDQDRTADVSHKFSPALVTELTGHVVRSFAFSRTGSAVLIATRLYALTPSSGPQKSFSELRITGCGFWDSEDMIVKFVKKITGKEPPGVTPPPPRSCAAKLIAPGVISCKPPKLAECGLYEVHVSMDGVVFSRDVLIVDVYPDLSVTALTPKILDMRDPSQSHVILTVKGFTPAMMQAFQQSDITGVDVKLAITRGSGGSITTKEAMVRGRLVDAETAQTFDILEQYRVANDDSSATQMPNTGRSSARSEKAPVTSAVAAAGPSLAYLLCEVLPVFEDENETFEEIAVLRAQVSLNGVDFSAVNMNDYSTAVVCHAFCAEELQPASCMCPTVTTHSAMAAEMSEVVVKGKSFFAAGTVPSTVSVQAVISAVLTVVVDRDAADEDFGDDSLAALEATDPEDGEGEGVGLGAEKGDMAAGMGSGVGAEQSREQIVEVAVEYTAPATCLSSTEMSFIPPSMSQLQALARIPHGTVQAGGFMRTNVKFLLFSQETALPTPKSTLSKSSRGGTQSLQLNLSTSKKEDASQAMLSSKIVIPLTTGEFDAENGPLTLDLFVPQPVSVTPTICRRSENCLLTISGTLPGGFRFRPTEAKVVLTVDWPATVDEDAHAGEADAEGRLEQRELHLEGPDQLSIIPPKKRSRRHHDHDQEHEQEHDQEHEHGPGASSSADHDDTAAAAAVESNLDGDVEGKGDDGDANASADVAGVTEQLGNLALDHSELHSLAGDSLQSAVSATDVEYKIQSHVPDFNAAFTTTTSDIGADIECDGDANAAAVPAIGGTHVELVSIKVLLDGSTDVPPDFACSIILFDAIEILNVNNPKGGFVPGPASEVVLSVSGLPKSPLQSCIVRLRGEATDKAIELDGVVRQSTNEISFALPEADQINSIPPVLVKKAKFYFVEVSIDNGKTFDASSSAILNIK